MATALMAGVMSFGAIDHVNAAASTAKGGHNMITAEKLKLETKWDKVFEQSDKVNHRKVTFVNRFGITLAADVLKFP